MPPNKKTNPEGQSTREMILDAIGDHRDNDSIKFDKIFNKLEELAVNVAKIVTTAEGDHKVLHGNGQPGLIKTVDDHISGERAVKVYKKWLLTSSGALIGAIGFIAGSASQFWELFKLFKK